MCWGDLDEVSGSSPAENSIYISAVALTWTLFSDPNQFYFKSSSYVS